MKTNYISKLILVFLLINYSCKKELVPQDSPSSPLPIATENTTESSVLNPEVGVNSSQDLPQTQNPSKGLNPPHGQEGHRCDIAVGAPLNSPVVKPNLPPQAISNTPPAAVLNTTTNVVTKPGMNPPHGQAGHRCDIAVGAPLNSPQSTPAVPAILAAPTAPVIPVADSIATSPKI